MLNLSYEGVHRFVDGHPQASWDGWSVVMFKPDPRGATSPRGALKDGQWGVQTRVAPDTKGVWHIRA